MSLYDLAELCGVNPSPDLYLEIMNQTATTISVRFANQLEATVIYYKITL